MPTQAGILDITFVADQDLRTKQYFFVKLQSTGTPYGVVLASAITDNIIGVLQNEPNVGEPAVVRVAGTTKVSAGTPVGLVVGDEVTTDANGQACKASTTPYASIGLMLESTATTAVGDVVEILIARSYKGEY